MTLDIVDLQNRLSQPTDIYTYNILQEVISLHKQGKLTDDQTFQLLRIKESELSNIDEKFASLKKPELPFHLSLDDILSNPTLKKAGLASYQLTDSDKLKQFMFSCLVEAHRNNYKLSNDHSIIYTDAGHDIDDQMALAKEMALTILLGGTCSIRMNGHAPFSAISIHKELFESMLELKDQLFFDIENSQILKPEFQKFCEDNSSKTDRSRCVQFSTLLIPGDLADRSMHIGEQDFFKRPYQPFTQDYYHFLGAKHLGDTQQYREYINLFNQAQFDESTREPSGVLTGECRQQVKVQVISRIDEPELTRIRSKGAYYKFYSQGGVNDFNLKLIQKVFDKTRLQDLTGAGYLPTSIVTVNNSLITSFGLGQVDSSKVEEQSFFGDMLLHLDGEYVKNKQAGWARSGMVFDYQGDSLVTRPAKKIGDKFNFGFESLSFEGLLHHICKIQSAITFPVTGILESQRVDNPKLMTPLRFILELKKQNQDGSLGNVYRFSNNDDKYTLEFESQELKNLAVEFYHKHHEFENKILRAFVGMLNQTQKTTLGIVNDNPDPENLKNQLSNQLVGSRDLQRLLQQAINDVYSQEDPLTFYTSRVKEFCRQHPDFIRPSILYDTTIPAITRLVDKDLAQDLLKIQDNGDLQVLDLSADLMEKIKKYLDDNLDKDTNRFNRIKEFYQTVYGLRTTLNDSLFAPESIASEAVKTFEVKPGYFFDEQLLIPIYRQDESDSFKSIHYSEGFLSFTTDPNFTFLPGATYYPYFDEFHQPKLAMSNEGIDINMKFSNQYQIKLLDQNKETILSQTFQAPPQQITQPESQICENPEQFFSQPFAPYQYTQPTAPYQYAQPTTPFGFPNQGFQPYGDFTQYARPTLPYQYAQPTTPFEFPNQDFQLGQPSFASPYTYGSVNPQFNLFAPTLSFDSMHCVFSSHTNPSNAQAIPTNIPQNRDAYSIKSSSRFFDV